MCDSLGWRFDREASLQLHYGTASLVISFDGDFFLSRPLPATAFVAGALAAAGAATLLWCAVLAFAARFLLQVFLQLP
jgi:hypothetical protein